MIFAAGLGTRLKPLTNDRPKALVEVNGQTLLERVIWKMKAAGVQRVVINVFHFADLVDTFLKNRPDFDMDIVVSDERDGLLDTGGGLLKARDLFIPGEPVLMHNVDILSDLNIGEVIAHHRKNKNYATLVVKPTMENRVLKFNSAGLLKGWENKLTGEQKIVDDEFYGAADYSFCGIHVVSAHFLQQISHRGVFSIIDEYIMQAKSHDLPMFFHDGQLWDLGTPQAIEEANLRFRSGEIS